MSAALLPIDDRPSRRVAIVEDEGILALDIERHLRSCGFEVTGVASDADAAITLVETTRPDLVLMDIRIQGTRDGVETAAVLRQRFDVPVVYLTAHSDAGTMQRAHSTSPLGYLLKPFKKPDLENVVNIALQRNQLEGRLRRREALLSTTLACIDEAVVTTDDRGVVTFGNEAASTLTGFAAEELVGRPWAEVIRLRDRAGVVSLPSPCPSPGPIDATMDAAGGRRAVVGAFATLMQGPLSFGSVVALRDLTELLEARRQVEFAERLASLGALAAGVAHEVNNPLSVVVANLHFALADSTVSGELRQVLTESQDAATRVSRIVRDLHSLGRPQVEELTPMSPLHAVASALSLSRIRWRPETRVRLRLGAVPCALGASTRLAQVLVNLIVNAVQALRTVPEDERELEVSAMPGPRGEAVIAVVDSAGGVPLEARARLFEPFFTTKDLSEGTGLGLAVSRTIARSHGGDLRYEPRDDARGSRFILTLPAAQRQVAPPLRALWLGERTPALAALEAGGATVLQRSPDDPQLREEVARFEPTVVMGNAAAHQTLRREHGNLEALTLVAGEETELGTLTLLEPFDVEALAWLAAR